jgi:hypothetical protein
MKAGVGNSAGGHVLDILSIPAILLSRPFNEANLQNNGAACWIAVAIARAPSRQT